MNPDNESVKLPNTLSHTQLTIGLIALTFIPFLFVVSLYYSSPTTPDPRLDAQVAIGPRTWMANDGVQTRLLPSLILTNATQNQWRNVNMSINEQFYYYHDRPVQPGEELVVPLKFFHTKGNQFYPPESQPLGKLTVFAQIPSGARAICELDSKEIPGLGSPTDSQ